ncbi:MAG TPA: helix-turn-helix domain-containing protein [Kofleriaceae bacterium]|nr:helix-turn-helix domain-containing protein [Kofleriaceae bacterium]
MPRKDPEIALYVKLPAAAGDKLDRASEALGIAKKDLVAGLVERYVDPDSRSGLSTLAMGTYSFQPYDPPEVLTPEQAARLLQVDEKLVVEMAEAGKLPGRKLGKEWRFSRDALVAWLARAER